MLEQQEDVELLDLFFMYFKPQVLEDALRAVVKTYPQTALQMRTLWPGAEGVDVRPHVQRANVIQSLRAVGEKHRQSGVAPKELLNAGRNSRNIMLVGGDGSLTPHYVPEKSAQVRHAAYRRLLCSPNVLDLFTLDKVPRETALHAYLVHGCDGIPAVARVDREVPDFVYVRFPIVGQGVYAAQSLDLLEMFPHVLGRDQSTSVDHVIEHVEDDAMPEMLPDQKRGDAG